MKSVTNLLFKDRYVILKRMRNSSLWKYGSLFFSFLFGLSLSFWIGSSHAQIVEPPKYLVKGDEIFLDTTIKEPILITEKDIEISKYAKLYDSCRH